MLTTHLYLVSGPRMMELYLQTLVVFTELWLMNHAQGPLYLYLLFQTLVENMRFSQRRLWTVVPSGRIFEKYHGVVWTGLIWLRVGASSGLMWTRGWNLGFHETLRNSWICERLLASQERLAFLEMAEFSLLFSVWYNFVQISEEDTPTICRVEIMPRERLAWGRQQAKLWIRRRYIPRKHQLTYNGQLGHYVTSREGRGLDFQWGHGIFQLT
jgi:hypothetical protein